VSLGANFHWLLVDTRSKFAIERLIFEFLACLQCFYWDVTIILKSGLKRKSAHFSVKEKPAHLCVQVLRLEYDIRF